MKPSALQQQHLLTIQLELKVKIITTISRKRTICILKTLNAIILTCNEFFLMA